jgi:hypothetical protein
MLHDPGPVGVTVNVATYTELPRGFEAGRLAGLTVAQSTSELAASMVPTNWTDAVTVAPSEAGIASASEVGDAVKGTDAPPRAAAAGAVSGAVSG